MPDGSVIKGAQGNFPFLRAVALGSKYAPEEVLHKIWESLYSAPWLKDDNPIEHIKRQTAAKVAAESAEIPLGVIPRHRTSPLYPVQVPDLIGVKDRKYLDRTGLQLHRSLVDMMRYAALDRGETRWPVSMGSVLRLKTFTCGPTRPRKSDTATSSFTRWHSTSTR